MSEGHHTQGAPGHKGEEEFSYVPGMVLSEWPLILPWGLYSRVQIMDKLKIGKSTLSKWLTHGLRPIKPETKAEYFLGSEVIQFMVDFRDGFEG
jgi:hypothetical protein